MKTVYPHISLLRPNFVYRNAVSTDVTVTWRKHGWKPKLPNHALPFNRTEDFLKYESRGIKC